MFTSGWVNENEISLQPENTVRDMMNFRVISDSQNTYSAEIIKGNSILFQLNPNYRPIGWTIQGEKFVVFSTDSTGAGGNGEVGVVYLNIDTLQPLFPLINAYVPIYNHRDLNFTQAHMIGKECRIQKENENIERVYWTDNYNPPRALNIANRAINTFLNPPANIPSGSLIIVPPTSYMVLQGRVEYPVASGNFYGPNEILGTVFTTNGFNTTYTSTGTTIVVLYQPNVATLDQVPFKALGNIFFKGWQQGGELKCADYQIAYQLETSDGFLTDWSYLSQGVHVTVEDPLGSTPNQPIAYANYIGHPSTVVTTKALKYTISGVDTNFFKIRVAYVETDAYQIPNNPIVFWESVIAEGVYIDSNGKPAIDVLLKGNENIQILPAGTGPLDALEVEPADVDRVKTLTTLKNRLFEGNITAGFNFDWDPSAPASGTQVNLVEYLVPTDIFSFPTTNFSTRFNPPLKTDIPAGYPIHGHIELRPENNPYVTTGNNFIMKDQWYQVLGSGSIIYNAITYNHGDTFQGVTHVRTFTPLSGTVKVIGIIKIQRYTGKYDIIPIEGDFADSKGQMADFYLRSHWRAETYRFGVLLWKKRGQPQYVKWLADKTIPHQYETTGGINFRLAEPEIYVADAGSPPYTGTDGINLHTSLRHIGLSIDDLDFNTLAANLGTTFDKLGDFFDGFSIVRAPRDKQILCQGLWYPTVIENTATVPQITEALFNLTSNPLFQPQGPRPDVYQLFSPEVQFAFNNDAVAPKAGDVMDIADYLAPNPGLSLFEQCEGILDTNNFHFYQKQYTQIAATADDYPKNSGPSLLNPSGSIFVNAGATGLFPPNAKYIFNNQTTAQDHNGVGQITYVIELDKGPFTPIGFGWPIKYTANNGLTPQKALVNYVRPKGNLYGGNTESAKASTLYAYVGHFQAFDTGFMAHLASTSGGKAVGKARGIQVFGGDCFVQMYATERIMGNKPAANQISCATVFPVESSVNTNLREGTFFNKDRNYEPPENVGNGINWAGPPLRPEQYIVNKAYSSTFDLAPYVRYPSQPIGFIPARQFEHRVIYSLMKVDGEIIDNYRIFLPLNYIDLEGWTGQINNLRAKHGRLFYWQDNGFGYIPVLERELSTGVTGLPVTLGTGGVAQRYDEFNNFFGNQHKHGLCETEDDFYWFDNRRKAFCFASTGGQLIEVSTIKGLRSFLKNNVVGPVALNDNPILGGGIWAEYNGMYKEVVMNFKNVDFGDFTIAYNTLNKHFSGRYSFTPGITLDFYDHYISTNPDLAPPIRGNTSYNISDVVSIFLYPVIIPAHLYNLGDHVSEGQINYVNILSYTSATPPIQPSLDPTHWMAINTLAQGTGNYINIVPYTTNITPTQPFVDVAHWVLINDIRDVWMHNRLGDQISNHYGKVDDAFLVKIMNDNYSVTKVIDNIKQNSDSNFWSSIIYNNTTQIGSDLGIDIITNKDFRLIDKSWYYNIPFDDISQSRLVDGWLSGKFVKDNRALSIITGLLDPTTSKNEILKVVSMIYTYRKTY